MFESAIEYLKQRFIPQPLTLKVGAQEYKVQPGEFGPQIAELIVPPAKPAVRLESLTGFIDAYNAKIDGFYPETSAIHVIDYKTVALVSLLADSNGKRQEWLRAVCTEDNPFPFNQYTDAEQFLLNLQSGFLPTENTISLQRLASALSNDSSIATQDDGMSQTVTVKQGAVTRDSIPLPPRIELLAFRTFREIDPIASEFMVRLKGEPGKLPKIGLLEIDAGRWKHDTMRLVKGWLSTSLPDAVIIA
jgi:hypothetical protein